MTPPLIEIHARVSQRDFALGYALMRQRVSPLHLPGVQAGLSLTAAGLCACMIPTFVMYAGSAAVPASAAGFFLMLAAACLWAFPALLKSRAAALYRQNRPLALPYLLRLFPDRILWENECETITAYWTDIHRCLESPVCYALCGNLQKPLLVIPKKGLAGHERVELSRIFQNKLAVRYRGGERT